MPNAYKLLETNAWRIGGAATRLRARGAAINDQPDMVSGQGLRE